MLNHPPELWCLIQEVVVGADGPVLGASGQAHCLLGLRYMGESTNTSPRGCRVPCLHCRDESQWSGALSS